MCTLHKFSLEIRLIPPSSSASGHVAVTYRTCCWFSHVAGTAVPWVVSAVCVQSFFPYTYVGGLSPESSARPRSSSGSSIQRTLPVKWKCTTTINDIIYNNTNIFITFSNRRLTAVRWELQFRNFAGKVFLAKAFIVVLLRLISYPSTKMSIL